MRVCNSELLLQPEVYYNWNEFDFQQYKNIPLQSNRRGNQGNKKYKEVKYKDCHSSFDIETSLIKSYKNRFISNKHYNTLPKKMQEKIDYNSYMYVWMFDLDGFTVVGRTWKELKQFFDKLNENLKDDERQVVWVHNLSYEFHFLKGIFDLKNTDIFCLDDRHILKCLIGKLELRCSFKQTNISLDKLTSKYKVPHKKLAGTYDYSKFRLHTTNLSDDELAYCINDVKGLNEAMKLRLKEEDDDFKTVPTTSTGYVRREAKRVLRPSRQKIKGLQPDFELFLKMRNAFRGGDTHANPLHANVILENLHSWDRASSYPDVLVNCKFPMSKFYHYKEELSSADIVDLMQRRGKALLMTVALENVKPKNLSVGCPYLAYAKCNIPEYKPLKGEESEDELKENNYILDNGRILYADYIECTITDIDFKIILNEYDFDEIHYLDVYSSNYAYLPHGFTELVKKYFRKKTELKDIKGSEFEYAKFKELINALYGMIAQNPLKPELKWFDSEKKLKKTDKPSEELFKKAIEKSFIPYQWAVWCTSWARLRLHELIWLVGDDFVYCDTDSVKFLHNHSEEIRKLNEKLEKESLSREAFAYNKDGKRFILGVYEQEKDYKKFKTLGSKKYVYTYYNDVNKNNEDVVHTTIAGVNKELGGEELMEHGGIGAFQEGFIFKKAGGTSAIYRDHATPLKIEVPIGSHKGFMTITTNVAIIPSTYEVTIKGDYKKILSSPNNLLKLKELFGIIKK